MIFGNVIQLCIPVRTRPKANTGLRTSISPALIILKTDYPASLFQQLGWTLHNSTCRTLQRAYQRFPLVRLPPVGALDSALQVRRRHLRTRPPAIFSAPQPTPQLQAPHSSVVLVIHLAVRNNPRCLVPEHKVGKAHRCLVEGVAQASPLRPGSVSAPNQLPATTKALASALASRQRQAAQRLRIPLHHSLASQPRTRHPHQVRLSLRACSVV